MGGRELLNFKFRGQIEGEPKNYDTAVVAYEFMMKLWDVSDIGYKKEDK